MKFDFLTKNKICPTGLKMKTAFANQVICDTTNKTNDLYHNFKSLIKIHLKDMILYWQRYNEIHNILNMADSVKQVLGLDAEDLHWSWHPTQGVCFWVRHLTSLNFNFFFYKRKMKYAMLASPDDQVRK